MGQGFDITLFYLTFSFYMGGFLAFATYIGIRKNIVSQIGIWLMLLGLITHSAAFITRWVISGHIPLANMYEYLSLMDLAAVVLLLVITVIYKRPLLGSLVAPVVFMLIVTAALLPKEANQSLMPALRSIWLNIHVLLAAIGSGCFLISFGASTVFLVRSFSFGDIDARKLRKTNLELLLLLVGVPVMLTLILSQAGFLPPALESRVGTVANGLNFGSIFILLGTGFLFGIALTIIRWQFNIKQVLKGYGSWIFVVITFSFLTGGIIEGLMIKSDWIVLTQSLSSVTHGENVKSAWLVFEFTGVAFLIGLPVMMVLLPLMKLLGEYQRNSDKLSLSSLDSVSYKAVSLGYPLYTVGALFAGAIWAEQAWGSFWSWDPKEVGALIVWLFYSGYLHARYNRGWKGTRAAVLVVAGFLMFILSFFGNYFFGGLHAYT